jgi:predicted pyridoxine 5'-phosphate oxidase superfamily flavin-nucleotide-binding protein
MEITEEARNLVAERPIMYLATVDSDGWPNVVPMLQYWWAPPELTGNDYTLVVGDLFMKKTVENVRDTGRASFSLTAAEMAPSFKFKGHARYETEGPLFDFAVEKLQAMKPGKKYKGVVVVEVCAAYDAARGTSAGALLSGEAV